MRPEHLLLLSLLCISINVSPLVVTADENVTLPACPGSSYDTDRLTCFLYWKSLLDRSGRNLDSSGPKNIPFRDGLNLQQMNNVMG
ncbi:Hypothetical predicted protein [Cloeon dipterum]|uniref:Uncharacterized protein n=1 Tax=Cloeon dipterum TaxID=197152 RepID=A0A8S1CSP5_9INSE|nr:Hypothetical predicted protein [Cloeon dipterum]